MPWTPAQRRLFHETAENPDAARRHGMTRREGGKLAEEADRLAREGREKPVRKADPPLPPGVVDLSPVLGRKP